jgi:ribosomal protein S18 acetylase RimI-like enzyme
MTDRVQIKQAMRDDLYEIAVLLHNSWRAEYRQIVLDDFLDTMSVDERHTGLLKRYDEGLSEFLMMLDGNTLIGAVVFGKSFTEGYVDDGEISAIYLHSEYIGKGYGHRLFVKTERLLHEKGFKYFVLDLLADNTRAFQFYLKHNYKKVADRTIKLGKKEYPLAVLRKKNDEAGEK